ncbi:unnamed protein product, partial [Ceratitis capitata]
MRAFKRQLRCVHPASAHFHLYTTLPNHIRRRHTRIRLCRGCGNDKQLTLTG